MQELHDSAHCCCTQVLVSCLQKKLWGKGALGLLHVGSLLLQVRLGAKSKAHQGDQLCLWQVCKCWHLVVFQSGCMPSVLS